MKNRDLYMKRLLMYKDKSVVKVITGVRRCGKSTLLDLYERHLLEVGVSSASIVRINLEDLSFDHLRDYRELNRFILEQAPTGKTYLMLDEIQQVSEWERTINSLRLDNRFDITITGSNAHMLSSGLSTLLSGRYVEIRMLPLSFREYLDFNELNADPASDRLLEHFNRFVENGGLPGLTELHNIPESIKPFLEGVFSTILLKDVVQRNAVRDATLLENLVRFMASSIGSPLSSRKISDFLTSKGRKTASDTIDSYLRMLEDAYFFYRARRYDINGKMYLKTLEKFYLVDTGLRTILLGGRGGDYGHVLENVVYFEWLRRGYEVSVGKLGTLEVDFVATSGERRVYCQVSATILAEETLQRELRPLLGISDNYEKLILTMDRMFLRNFEGIRIRYLPEFLLGNEF